MFCVLWCLYLVSLLSVFYLPQLRLVFSGTLPEMSICVTACWLCCALVSTVYSFFVTVVPLP